jgi:hypothetical protein
MHPRKLRGRWVAVLAPLVLVLILDSCKPGGSTYRIDPLPPGAGPIVPSRSEYRRALHPYWLFLGFQRFLIAENWLVSHCMRARGWSRFPILTGKGGIDISLDVIQSLTRRRVTAQHYGQLLLDDLLHARADDLTALQEFSDWLVLQPWETRLRFDHDFSGGRPETEPPAAGSCLAEALGRLVGRIPAADPNVTSWAGIAYRREVTGSAEYRLAARAWRACMARRGYPEVGAPLKVESAATERLTGHAQTLRPGELERLVAIVTQQAVAEHACSRRWLDDVVRMKELDAVRQIVARFPAYAGLVPRRLRGP